MSKRNLVAAAIMLFSAALGSAPAQADPDGCAALAAWVKAKMTAAIAEARTGSRAGGANGLRRLRLFAPAPGGRHTCGTTAAVASRAFGEAVGGMDLLLSWNGDWLRPGDYCLSHDLDQCYPRQNPFSPLPPPSDFAFIHRAWAGVTRALASQMPYGVAGDLSSFSDASLDAALSTEFRAAFDAPEGEPSRREVADRSSRTAR